jgi:hypothetical protein
MPLIPINPSDVPTRLHPQTVAELYSLAHAGDKAGFVAALNDGNPDEVEARDTARRLWIEIRAQLGLPEWL